MADLKLTRRHEIRPNGEEHFIVIGDCGAIHFHVAESSRDSRDAFGFQYYGGVEVHSKKPLYHETDTPTSAHCWILGCKCWHDGSSLMATEIYVPRREDCKAIGDFESLWRLIEEKYRSQFEESVK